MPEAQYTVSGFNISGLDPIEVSKPVAGSSITLADSDIGKMNVFSGAASTTVTVPSASGTLDGYSKAGRMIGLRGRSDMNAVVTINLPGAVYLRTLLKTHLLVLVSDGATWYIKDHYWPPMLGYVSASRGSDVGVPAGVNSLVYNTIDEGNADGWYNASTGVYSPLMPGYYEIEASALISQGATSAFGILQARASSGAIAGLGRLVLTGSNAWGFCGSATLYANGVSDAIWMTYQGGFAGTFKGSVAESVFRVRYKGL